MVVVDSVMVVDSVATLELSQMFSKMRLELLQKREAGRGAGGLPGLNHMRGR
jgi:hypothetical protein